MTQNDPISSAAKLGGYNYSQCSIAMYVKNKRVFEFIFKNYFMLPLFSRILHLSSKTFTTRLLKCKTFLCYGIRCYCSQTH